VNKPDKVNLFISQRRIKVDVKETLEQEIMDEIALEENLDLEELSEESTDEEGNDPEEKPEEKSEEEELLEIAGQKLSKAEAERVVKDYLNDNSWKKRNEEKGRELNQALEINTRLQKDQRFKEWMDAYEDDELLQLKDEVGNTDLAKQILEIKRENRELKQKFNEKETYSAWEAEEKELIQAGATEEELGEVYEIVNEYNSSYLAKHKKPMPLIDAMGIANSRGKLGGMMTKIKAEMKKNILEELRAKGKKSLPSSVPGTGAGVIGARKEPANEEDAMDALFSTPLFAGIKKRNEDY